MTKIMNSSKQSSSLYVTNNGDEVSVLLISSSDSNSASGEVHRRLQQDPDADERASISSTSNETDFDEYHSLIDESQKKSAKAYAPAAILRVRARGAGNVPVPGNNCTRNKFFMFCLALFGFATLLMMNLPMNNEKGRIGTISGWSANTSRQTVNYVLPGENTTVIDPFNVCSHEERTGDGSEREKVFLLIVVCSSAGNFEARQTIRETWGNVSEFNYSYFARIHEHMKDEYLQPRPVHRFREYFRRTGADDDGGVPLKPWKGDSIPTANARNVSSSNKSSQSNVTETVSALLGDLHEGQLLNVKVVFLLGQSETDYLHQRRRTLNTEQTTDSQRQPMPPEMQTVSTRPESNNRAPSVSLFPAGDDVDPAFNVREEELDEMQMKILNESEVYGDIIQESFIDSYNNLTLKTIMMLKWAINNCNGRVKFIMKCDDDTFVNVPNLLQVLLGGTVPLYNASLAFYDSLTVAVKSNKNRLPETKRLLTGFLFCGVKPIADTSSKWYSPNYMYNKEYYPNYLSGTAYLMNLDAAKLLYRASLTTPIFHLEDVYLTGIVADRVKLHRSHHPLFFYSYTKDLCALRGMISQHQLQPADLQNAYEFVTNSSVTCRGVARNFTMAKMKLQQRKKCQ
ncbi:uncharacterized protein LOC129739590 [Uranotaenia lowii]|uniref:uncharacterized protein LOC129739590 n=1 Tax=Uranotaenia lowii TaxID=190385 RepID=UPI002478C94E|nr:uncharacterized protein LOC129739590 [Uranotaenia lowii]XP_055587142.1 uncharacterized protein LOC129739590 [Uranotaenia lowii]